MKPERHHGLKKMMKKKRVVVKKSSYRMTIREMVNCYVGTSLKVVALDLIVAKTSSERGRNIDRTLQDVFIVSTCRLVAATMKSLSSSLLS